MIKYRFKLKIRNGARSCATCSPGIRKCRLGLELVDEHNEVTVAGLVDILCSEIRELMLRLHIVDGGLSFRHELLHEEVPKGDVLRLGVDVAGEQPQVVQRILFEKHYQVGCDPARLSAWQ